MTAEYLTVHNNPRSLEAMIQSPIIPKESDHFIPVVAYIPKDQLQDTLQQFMSNSNANLMCQDWRASLETWNIEKILSNTKKVIVQLISRVSELEPEAMELLVQAVVLIVGHFVFSETILVTTHHLPLMFVQFLSFSLFILFHTPFLFFVIILLNSALLVVSLCRKSIILLTIYIQSMMVLLIVPHLQNAVTFTYGWLPYFWGLCNLLMVYSLIKASILIFKYRGYHQKENSCLPVSTMGNHSHNPSSEIPSYDGSGKIELNDSGRVHIPVVPPSSTSHSIQNINLSSP